MNVGLVVPGFSADAADWCIPALRHLARSLATQDDVRVIALRYPYRPARYSVDGADVISLGGALRHGSATFDLWRQALGVMRAEHRRRPFDVLHAFWATESGLLAAMAGRMLGVPTLVSLAGGELVALPEIGYGDQRIAWERLKVAASLRLASGVSAGSRLLQAVAQRHVRRRKQVYLAPLGVDLTLFSAGPSLVAGSDMRRVVHVGTLTRVKDQAMLLRAFAMIHGECAPACLEIVGEGPLLRELERLSRELALEGSVCFRGAIDHAALPNVYRGASAFVVSSRHEAQSMVAVEAAACGVPLVGTRVGVVPEVTSAVAPVADHRALADSLAATLSSTAEPTVSSASVRARFGLEACTDRFRELYASVGRG